MILIYIFLILALLISILIILSPVILIIYGIVKKKTKLVVIPIILTTLLCGCVILWNVIFPTEYPYVDNWIYGKTQEEIVATYGEPFSQNETHLSYNLGDAGKIFGVRFLDEIGTEIYYIYFDENGKAYKIEKEILNN